MCRTNCIHIVRSLVPSLDVIETETFVPSTRPTSRLISQRRGTPLVGLVRVVATGP